MATFRVAPGVGAALAPGPTAGSFKMAESSVPGAIFSPGKAAAERVRAYLAAGGDRAPLADYAAYSLRRAAQSSDGTLNSAAFDRWHAAHAEALSAMPDVAARFQSVRGAQNALDQAQATHVAARDAFERSAASHFLGDANPVQQVGRILNSDSGEAQMRHLAALTARAPAARAGLQKAVVDHIMGTLRNARSAGDEAELSSAKFQAFFRKAEPALRQVFDDKQVRGMRNLALDLQRADKSVSGTKLPGGSNTAQDLAAAAKHGHGGHGTGSMVGQLVIAETLGDLGEHLAGPLGKVASIGSLVFNAMRHAGLKKVDDLVAQAMLHPGLAASLMAKAPATAHGGIMPVLLQQIRGLALRSPATPTGPAGPRRYAPTVNPYAALNAAPPVSAGVPLGMMVAH